MRTTTRQLSVELELLKKRVDILYDVIDKYDQDGSLGYDREIICDQFSECDFEYADVEIFTDGSCENPGRGGWAFRLKTSKPPRVYEESGAESNTTNNRMEMMAAIKALERLSEVPCASITVNSDSKYVVDGINRWIKGWKRDGWMTGKTNKDRSPVKNQDLWVRLDKLKEQTGAEFRWVRGHNGNVDNERVDSLAVIAMRN